MKFILLIATLFFSSFIYAQRSYYIEDENFEGYVFDKETFYFGTITNQKERYTPTKEDILNVESLLTEQMDYILASQFDPTINAVIYPKSQINKRTIKKYIRQYIGFRTNDNEIIILVFFNYKDKYNKKEDFSRDIRIIYGGGHHHWSIFVNLTKKVLFNMQVNGLS